MNRDFTGKNSQEIDLAFNAFDFRSSNNIFDSSAINLLTKAKPWLEELGLWLDLIRSNEEVKCPAVVRNTFSLSMGIQFTNDSIISSLNKKWRKQNKSTDVLSFPVINEDEFIPIHEICELGDIIVSVTTAEKQAKANNHELSKELRWLVSHGFLHLLGWDHYDDFSLKQMLNFQEQLLNTRGNLQVDINQ